MNIINRKQFNRLLNETIKDFEAIGHGEMVKKLRKILKCKNINDMTIPMINPLIELIVITELKPIIHPVDYEIRREHEKMKKYLQQFFQWELIKTSEVEYMIFIKKIKE